MKIAGLMQTNEVVQHPLTGLVDVTISYIDTVILLQPSKQGEETIVVINHEQPWNEYANRMAMLSRATAYGAEWVMWTDSDFTFPSLTADLIRSQVSQAIEGGHIGISYNLREMWNKTHWRSDGIWGIKRKVILQRNPLMQDSVKWKQPHLMPLHHFPIEEGSILETDSEILHWGMDSQEKREARVKKHQKLDPENKLQSFGYDYMLSTDGMTLTPI